jgi:excisionase family DNA binding protein
VRLLKLLSTTETATRLGISSQRVLQFTEEGRLKGQKVAGRWVFREREVERFASLTRSSGRPPNPTNSA